MATRCWRVIAPSLIGLKSDISFVAKKWKAAADEDEENAGGNSPAAVRI